MKTITPCRPKWKGILTDRERFIRQMHYQPIDRTFNMEFGYWDENFKLWPMFFENGITTNEEADRYFNFDRLEPIQGVLWMSPPFERITVEVHGATKILIKEDGLF